MSVYSLLTEQDKELITEYIKVYASSGSHEIQVNLPITLREWDNVKSQTLLPLLGGKDLILRRKFRHEQTEAELLEYYQEASENSNILSNIKFAISHILRYSTSKNDDEITKIVDSLFSEKNIINNSYSGEQINIKFLDGTCYRITPKSKLLRIINYLGKKDIDNIYQQEITNFTNWCSQLRNQKLIEGDLCLSIHPLDFFTLSDNASNWSSCISWYSSDNEAGERRAGTLECLNSPRVIVAYLDNVNHPFEFSPGKFWNNKQWRELFIFDKGLISEVKAYPYQNKTLTTEVLTWLKELANKNLGYNYGTRINLALGYIEHLQETLHIIPTINYFMFNDFGRLNSHQGIIDCSTIINSYPKENETEEYVDSQWHTHKFIHINYGGRTTCLKCGCDLPQKEEFYDRVLCGKCEPGFKCAYCRKWIDNGKKYYNIEFSEEPICKECYYHNTFIDDLTGKTIMKDSMIKLFWEDNEGNSSINYLSIQDPGFYDRSDLYWQVFSDYPNIYYDNEYYVTPDMIKDMAKFMKLYKLAENPFA